MQGRGKIRFSDTHAFAMPLAIGVLFFCASMAVSALFLSKSVFFSTQRPSRAVPDSVLEAAATLKQLLESDPTPEADSRLDPGGEYMQPVVSSSALEKDDGLPDSFLPLDGQPDISVSIADISSRLNLNLVRVMYLTQPLLSGLLTITSRELDAKRSEQFPLAGSPAGSSFITKGYAHLFTDYSLFNIDQSDEASLEKYTEMITGSKFSAAILRDRVQEYRLGNRLWSESDLNFLSFFDDMDTVLTIEPVFNVHFVPDRIVKALFSWPFGGKVSSSLQAAGETILGRRNSGQILPNELETLIGNAQLRSLFGTRTAFWGVWFKTGNRYFEGILMRIPGDEHKKVLQWIRPPSEVDS